MHFNLDQGWGQIHVNVFKYKYFQNFKIQIQVQILFFLTIYPFDSHHTVKGSFRLCFGI